MLKENGKSMSFFLPSVEKHKFQILWTVEHFHANLSETKIQKSNLRGEILASSCGEAITWLRSPSACYPVYVS